jgi:hypothetical protein
LLADLFVALGAENADCTRRGAATRIIKPFTQQILSESLHQCLAKSTPVQPPTTAKSAERTCPAPPTTTLADKTQETTAEEAQEPQQQAVEESETNNRPMTLLEQVGITFDAADDMVLDCKLRNLIRDQQSTLI